MDFADIGKLLVDGKNLGGLSQRIYFGLWTDVATWPTEPADPLTLDALGTLTGDIAMKPGKRMFELYSTEDAAKLAINPIGEEGGKGYELVLSVFAPGLHKKLLGFMNATKNEDLVLIAMDSQNQMYLLGSDIRSAKFQGGDGSGTGSTTDGRRGLGMQFAFRNHSLYTYTGSVPLTATVPAP
jgi:hypothetical protein